jgi:AraC family transcriptional regulator, regulatory protein of adaptative response / DNA-3-methyladenine glycosylase II
VSDTPVPDADGWQPVRLPFRPPLARAALLRFLGPRAVPGVEQVVGGEYRRSLRLPGGPGVVVLTLVPTDSGAGRGDGAAVDDGHTGTAPACIEGRLWLHDPGDRPAAVAACRRVLDLDADPAATDGALGTDPLLAPLVSATPGRRAPGHVDPAELAVRAVLGQQVSLAAARRLAGQVAALCGEPLPRPSGDVTTVFPPPGALADADLERIGMPASRRATLRTLDGALASRDVVLDPGADRDEAERSLLALPGIGPWTAAYVRMRGLGDPDVFLAGDAGVRRALATLGLTDGPAAGDRWRPWRSYAVHHLWAGLA